MIAAPGPIAARQWLVGQFRQPRGPAGWLAGTIMANRPSNRRRNEWTVDLLELEPWHRVLEIGCGPGLALEACAKRLTEGRVVGLDHSTLMIGQARRRLAALVAARRGGIAAGRAELRLGGLADLPVQEQRFDRVFSVNLVPFLPDLDQAFKRLKELVIADGGLLATTFQPRSRPATRAKALEMADRIETAMHATGFVGIERHELPLAPAPAICVIGRSSG